MQEAASEFTIEETQTRGIGGGGWQELTNLQYVIWVMKSSNNK